MMQAQTITVVSDKSGLTTITLNRPDIHNALNSTMIQEFHNALQLLANDVFTRALLLTANGPSFSSGADLHSMRAATSMTKEENLKDAQQLSQLLQTLYVFPKPVLVKVQGPAYGGALGLISCCDIAIASYNAEFCFSETRLGLAPAIISPYVIAAIGKRAAQRYFLTAEIFNAEKACDMGLIHAHTHEDELHQYCNHLLNMLLNNGPHALQKTKQLITQVAKAPYTNTTREFTEHLIADLRCSPEGQEGIEAFLQKRKPIWKQ